MSKVPRIAFGWVLVLGLVASSVHAQGLLIVTNATDRVLLPRPVAPRQPPPMAYKIKELSVHARLVDQIARVQVSQSFVNTGSRQMEVSFVFPLPYDGAIDQMTFLVDGKEYPGEAPAGQRSPADLRRLRATQPRPGPAGVDRHGDVPDERLSGTAGRRAQGDAPLQPAPAQGRQPDRLPLPARHGEVHLRAGREDRHRSLDRKLRSRSRTSTAPRTRSK